MTAVFAVAITIVCQNAMPGVYGHLDFQARLVRASVRDRDAAVAALMADASLAVARPDAVDEAAVAFRLLGHMRAVEAVPLLVENLTFSGYGRNIVRGSPVFERNYPCAFALASVGVPAIDAVADRAAGGDDPRVRGLAAAVIWKALGPNLAGDYLRRRQAAESDPTKAARLGQLLETVATIRFLP